MPGRAGSCGIHWRVCCSLLKALLFSSSGCLKLLLLSLGIKSLEMVAGHPAVPGREGSEQRGCARLGGRVSLGRGEVRKDHSPPPQQFGVQSREIHLRG